MADSKNTIDLNNIPQKSPHTFHIPVMGTGFTIDTPLKAAKYGISSVISLGDDNLIEQMRKYHCEKNGEPYEEITIEGEDWRARRITAYLNFVDYLVKKQVVMLQASPFTKGSDIVRYFEMLPDSPLKQAYLRMLATSDPVGKSQLQELLRKQAVPGSIDVNIMCSADRDLYRHGKALAPKFSLASSALRGYASSTLRSSIIFSAGLNQRLYTHLADFNDFFPDEHGELKKKITLKVSDYRSALIQGKFLARRGLWVSEYRIESGLNCGGHAFATKGLLIGIILQEFKDKRLELIEQLGTIYQKALIARGIVSYKSIPNIRITVQGGIGTAEENKLMLSYFDVDSTGWGTPFLLVPEVVNIDEAHLQKLCLATDQEVYLSDSSPFGVPFWNLRSSASEEARRHRIQKGTPGSPCPQGFLVSNKEFTQIPICPASRTYQKLKLNNLPQEGYSSEQLPVIKESVLNKSCICYDLAGSATLKNNINPKATPAICCGPNITNFSKITTLEDMINHIYGRISLVTKPDRPHMFLQELLLYIEYYKKEFEKFSLELSNYKIKYFQEFKENLLKSIDYYQQLAEKHLMDKLKPVWAGYQDDFDAMQNLREKIEQFKFNSKSDVCLDS